MADFESRADVEQVVRYLFAHPAASFQAVAENFQRSSQWLRLLMRTEVFADVFMTVARDEIRLQSAARKGHNGESNKT